MPDPDTARPQGQGRSLLASGGCPRPDSGVAAGPTRWRAPCDPQEAQRSGRSDTVVSRRARGTAGTGEQMKTAALVLTFLASATVSAQEPTTGYAPVNGLKMYYEIHGSGDPVVLLHGSFMTISNNWTASWGDGAANWIAEFSKTRKVIAVEMQGHGRTADIKRDMSYENLCDDVAALLDHLKIPRADLIGYSMGGGVAMQCAIRHPEKVRKVISISAVFRHNGWVKEALDVFPQLTSEALKGSPIETEYKKLSPTPDEFPSLDRKSVV